MWLEGMEERISDAALCCSSFPPLLQQEEKQGRKNFKAPDAGRRRGAKEAPIRALNASSRQLWPSGSPPSPPFSGFSDGGHDDTSCNLSAKTKISPEQHVSGGIQGSVHSDKKLKPLNVFYYTLKKKHFLAKILSELEHFGGYED